MAYQINGNVIIDNDGKAFFNNLPLVEKPTNVSPANSSNVLGPNVELVLSTFSGMYQIHQFSQFQIANASSFASGNMIYDSGNIAASNTFTFSSESNIAVGIFYWRGKYISSEEGQSEFSDASSFNVTSLYPPPDGLGCPYQGGYFTGNIDIGGGVCYYLIVAPNSVGCGACRWSTPTDLAAPGLPCLESGANTIANVNGFFNTYTGLTSTSFPAGNFTATRSIAGYEDWYLPAQTELTELYNNRGNMPAGEGYDLSTYWSSTQWNVGNVCARRFDTGNVNNSYGKTNYYKARAVRRIPIV